MSRDPNKLRAFTLADAFAVAAYRHSERFPVSERYGLQSQLRRAASSVPTNLIEGCTRSTTREYARYVEQALGSACEARYLVGFSHRVGVMRPEAHEALVAPADEVVRVLVGLHEALRRACAAEAGHPRRRRSDEGTAA